MSTSDRLGTEKIRPLFFKLTIPAVLAQLVNMLYNMVDRMYIGHIPEEGAIALTGVSVSMPIIMVVSAFASLVGAGGAPRASIYLGAGKREDAEYTLNAAATIAVILAVVLVILFEWQLEPLLRFAGASPNSLPYATDYARFYLLGTLSVMFSLGFNFFISAQGDARTAMLTTLIGAVGNIILDPIFIFALDMGVRGAAVATVIAQTISALWVVRYLTSSKSVIRIHPEKLNLRPKYLLPVLALGISPFIMQSTEGVLTVVFNRELLRFGGDLYVGTMSINALVMQIAAFPISGLAQGATPIISYNYGANEPERVVSAFKWLLVIGVMYSTLITLIAVFAPDLFIRLFTSDAALMEATRRTMPVYCLGIALMGAQICCQQSFIAFGQAGISMMMALLRKVVLLIPMIYILPRFIRPQVMGVYWAEPVADIAAALTTVTMFVLFLRRKIPAMRLAREEARRASRKAGSGTV